MFLWGLGLCLVIMLDHKTILATAKVDWVFLGGLGHWWEVKYDKFMLDPGPQGSYDRSAASIL